jgi:RHS repeat-associated protein
MTLSDFPTHHLMPFMKRRCPALQRIHSIVLATLVSAGIATGATNYMGINIGGTCDSCKDGSPSGDAADSDNRSIDLKLHLGRAPVERPVTFSGFFALAGANMDDDGLPQSTGEVEGYFDKAGVEGIWGAELEFKSPVVSAAAFDPASLTYDSTFKMEVLKNGNTVRQVLTHDFLVDIQTLPSGQEGYVAKWWPAASKGNKSGGFYVPAGSPVKTVTVSNPNAFSGYTMLDVAMSQVMPGATTRAIHYRYDFSTADHRLETWTKKPGETGAVQIASNDLTYLSGAPVNGVEQNAQDRIRTIREADLDGGGAYGNLTVVSRTREVFADVGGKKRLVSLTRLSTAAGNDVGLKTTFGYYDTPSNSLLHGRKRWQKNPDGSWTVWNITASESSQTIIEISPFKDGTFVLADDGSNVASVVPGEARVVTSVITGLTIDTTESVAGQQVSRTRKDFLTGNGGERVLRTYEYFTAAHFFTTYKAYNPYGDGSSHGAGRIAWVTSRDGTASVYTYPAAKQVSVASGRASGTGESAAPVVNTAGTITLRNYNAFWQPFFETVTDIASNQVISMTAVENEDLYGRPERIKYNGNNDDYATTTYGCCGPVATRDRSGALTTTSYDLLKRVYSRSSKGSSTDVAVDTTTARAGLVTTVTRSADLASFTDSKSERNLLGETINTWSADADGQAVAGEAMERTGILTEYPAGGGTKVTTTDPLGATRITETYRDGSTKAVSGTGVHAMTYDYGSHALGGDGLWTKATLANGTEWTKSYSDRLGRTIRTEYPGGAYSARTYHASGIGAAGRLQSFKDADETAAAGTGTFTEYSYGFAQTGGSGPYREFTTVTEHLSDNQTRVSTTTSGVIASVTLHGTTLAPAAFTTTLTNGVTTSESFSATNGYAAGSVSFGRQMLTVRPVAVDGSWTVTTKNPDGTSSRASYDDGELELTEFFDNQGTDAVNLVASTGSTYDDFGRTLTTVDSRTGTTTVNGYRNNGAAISVTTNGGSDTTAFTHDALGRVVATTLPDTTIARTRYNLKGEMEASWGSQAYPTFRAYTNTGRLATLRTKPTLDANGVPTDAGGSVTSWIYSPTRGWLLEKNHDGESDNGTADADYDYTLAGRLKTRTWERGVVTGYGYDRGLLETVDYSDSTADLAYTHDAFGRPRTATQGSGATANTTTYAYKDDSNGSGGTLGTGLGLHSETVGYGASGLTRTLLRHEDSLLRPAGFELKNGAVVDHATAYGYDTAGRPKYVDPSYPLPATPAFAYGYEDDSIGLLKTVTGPAHTVTNVWEPNRDVLDTKTNADRASTPVTVSAFNYGVNNLGQRTGVATSGSAFSGGYAIGWAYNPSGELKEEDFGANQTSETRDRAFQYDAIGNREKTANGLLADLPGSPNYAVNGLNQYTVANGITLPTTPAAHDADGNAKAWNIRNPLATGSSSLAACTFTWDAENRLTEVRNSGGTVIATYAYDFQSRRIRKTVAGGEEVAFFYDGWNCIAEYQIGTSVPLVRYTWGQDLSGSMQGAGGVGGLLIVTKSSTSYYPTFDGNGNVSEYLNSSGAGVVHFEYDAFGNVVNFTESGVGLAATFRHRFSTKPQDTETGLLYYGYRYLDPVTGRWPSRDPIGETGGVNLYGFVENDGVNRRDYLGLIIMIGPLDLTPTPASDSEDVYDEDRLNDDLYDVHDYYYNTNKVKVEFCGCDPAKLSEEVKKAFKNFSHWDNESVDLEVDGDVGRFNPTGFGGILNDATGGFVGVGDTHSVTLLGGDGTYDQIVGTNEGHGLIGMRGWRHNMKSGGNTCKDPHVLTLTTEAFETYNNGAGIGWGLGVRGQINNTAKTLWTEYLSETAAGALKGLGCTICKGPDEVYSLYPETVFRQKNPFSDKLPKR